MSGWDTPRATGGFERVDGGRADFGRRVAEAHAGYHDETRRHHEPDALVDDVVTWQMLSPHLMRAGLFLVVPTVLVLIWLLLSYLSSMSGADPTGEAINSLVGLLAVVLYLAGLAALFAPAKEPIAEYSQLLEGRGRAAASAYDWVRRAAEARRAPAEVRSSTVGGVPVLLFAQHSERAMLLVQAYGDDLYVGWTMWRSRSSVVMLLHFLRDTFGRFGSGPRFSAELRAASTRALRESVHSLSREGVLAAVHAHEVPGAGRAGAPGPAQAGSAQAGTAPPPAVDTPAAYPGVAPGRETAAPRDERPRTGELPRPAPVSRDELYTPRREPEPRPRREHPDAGWGPPPRD
jgi:hypothetical protein